MIKRLLRTGLGLTRSRTAVDLYWVFSGNGLLIILTFFTTILIANNFTKAENGIFLALLTLANLLSDLGEAGLGSSLSSFIPGLILEANDDEAKKYVTTAFRIELVIAGGLLVLLALLAQPLSHWLFAGTATINLWITAVMTFILVLFGFSTFALSAYQQFAFVSLTNIFYSLVRLGLLVVSLFLFKLTLPLVLMIYTLAFGIGWVYSLWFLKPARILGSVSNLHARKLLSFSSVLALQKIFISISSRLDLLMLVPLSSAVEAGIYGIASRFALVYPLAISSLGQVLAPKFAEFGKGRDALKFFKKVGLVIGLLIVSQILFLLFAKPLIQILVPKYLEAIPVFQILIISMVGFVIATPFVSFIIYTLKKPYITAFSSFVQLIIIFISNWWFIPRYGRFAPAIGIGLGNLAICIITISATVYYLRKDYENRN